MKTRIVLEGEAAYTRAMSEAASEIKVLNAESRLAAAQFKQTGDAQAHAAEQARILKDQIAAQKRAVEAAEKAVADLTSKGVEPNDRAMQKWKTKLVNARTTLTRLQTKLDGVETDLKEDTTEFGNAGTAAEEYQASLQKIGGTIDTQAAIEAINKITGAIENTVRMAARATKAVVSMAVDAGKWADELKTTAEEMGVDPETLQSWQYASMFIDTEVSDISKSWQDITKRFGDGNNEFAVSLAQMGIKIQDTSGKFLTADKVFWNTIDYLHGMTDENAKAAKATEIFGNDWRKLMPLINAGSEAFLGLAEEGKEVGVVSNENVEKLGSMDDAINDLQSRVNKLKMDTLAAMAPTFERVATALSQAVTALDEFIQSKEGQQALESLGSALEGIINQFIGVDENGDNNFKKLVGGAKDIVKQLNTALQWLNEHSTEVATALTVIAGGYAALKIEGAVLTFMQLLKNTPLSKIAALFNGGKTGTPTGTGTPVPTGTGTGASAAAGGSRIAAKLSAGLSNFAWGALPIAGALTAATLPAVLAQKWDINNRHEQVSGQVKEAEAAAEKLGENANGLMEIVRVAGEALDIDYNDKDFLGQVKLGDPARVDRGLKALQPYADLLSTVVDPSTMTQLEKYWANESELDQFEVTQLLENTMKTVTEALSSQADQAELDGEATAQGLADGIRAKTPEAVAAATDMANQVEAAISGQLDIHSPSKVMEKLGAFTAQGFAQGIERSTASVVRAVDGMMAITRRTPVGAYGAAGGVGGYAAGSSYSSSFYIDKYYQQSSEDARALAQRVQDANGWTRAGFGHRA